MRVDDADGDEDERHDRAQRVADSLEPARHVGGVEVGVERGGNAILRRGSVAARRPTLREPPGRLKPSRRSGSV